MNMSDDTSVANEQVSADNAELEASTGTGSSTSQEGETQDAKSDDQNDTEATTTTTTTAKDGELDPADPEYWQKKYVRDENNWKKRNSDLMSARQKAEHERDEAIKSRSTQTTSTSVSEKNESTTAPADKEPETFENTQDLKAYIKKEAAQIAASQVQEYLANDQEKKAQEANTKAYNERWEKVIKDNPDLDPKEHAEWMRDNNVFDPVHAHSLRNREKDIEAAERRGAEAVIKKIKSNKDGKTEGASRAAPVNTGEPVTKKNRAQYIREVLETEGRDSSH